MTEMLEHTWGSAGQSLGELRRMGKNHGGYHGETIDIASYLRECNQAARRHSWTCSSIEVTSSLELATYCRRAKGGSQASVYISAGIHGDEPAGIGAVRSLLQANTWPTNVDLWLCPCLNPTGFEANRRENAAGTDLNRQYLQPQAEEIIAHIGWLEKQPRFDMCLSLHEDWESHGFYLYELCSGPRSWAEDMIAAVAKVCPIDTSEVIEGRRARHGVIRPGEEHMTRTQWPEAFFLMMHKTALSYTLEAPSDFPLPVRVKALEVAVRIALQKVAAQC